MRRTRVKIISKIVALMAIAIFSGITSVEADDYIDVISLCRHDEVEYFNCKLQNSRKVASVCAADNRLGYMKVNFFKLACCHLMPMVSCQMLD